MFITFEGADGCGKSTQAALLNEYLNEIGQPSILTREPGGWEGGDVLRSLVLQGKLSGKWSEVFLFALDRSEHCSSVILPALAKGKHVICERYNDSTMAYQVWGRGMSYEAVRELLDVPSFPIPDVKVLFRISPETALERVLARGKPDSFEEEGFPFIKKVMRGYDALAGSEPEKWIVIECGVRSADEIFAEVKARLTEKGLRL
ncbi:MAG: dTMP kinase [Synergistes sp.]|nr:dTMP kinase [Synergistes sp.]